MGSGYFSRVVNNYVIHTKWTLRSDVESWEKAMKTEKNKD